MLYVRSVTTEGVTVLVTNSPKLLTFHIFIDEFEILSQDLEALLKRKLPHWRPFKGGSYQVGEICSVLTEKPEEERHDISAIRFILN